MKSLKARIRKLESELDSLNAAVDNANPSDRRALVDKAETWMGRNGPILDSLRAELESAPYHYNLDVRKRIPAGALQARQAASKG